eukprot:jgi/Botrbrau1/5615/Bobra.55_1s0004.1
MSPPGGGGLPSENHNQINRLQFCQTQGTFEEHIYLEHPMSFPPSGAAPESDGRNRAGSQRTVPPLPRTGLRTQRSSRSAASGGGLATSLDLSGFSSGSGATKDLQGLRISSEDGGRANAGARESGLSTLSGPKSGTPRYGSSRDAGPAKLNPRKAAGSNTPPASRRPSGLSSDSEMEKPDGPAPSGHRPGTKKQGRMIANRQSAHRSRQRKLQYVQDLENSIKKVDEDVSRRKRRRDELLEEGKKMEYEIAVKKRQLLEAETMCAFYYKKFKENERKLHEVHHAQVPAPLKREVTDLEPLIRDIPVRVLTAMANNQAGISQVTHDRAPQGPDRLMQNFVMQATRLATPLQPESGLREPDNLHPFPLYKAILPHQNPTRPAPVNLVNQRSQPSDWPGNVSQGAPSLGPLGTQPLRCHDTAGARPISTLLPTCSPNLQAAATAHVPQQVLVKSEHQGSPVVPQGSPNMASATYGFALLPSAQSLPEVLSMPKDATGTPLHGAASMPAIMTHASSPFSHIARQGSGSYSPMVAQGSVPLAPTVPQGSGILGPVVPQGSGSLSLVVPQGSGPYTPPAPQGSGPYSPMVTQSSGTPLGSMVSQGSAPPGPMLSQGSSPMGPSSPSAPLGPQGPNIVPVSATYPGTQLDAKASGVMPTSLPHSPT